jgi:hypothetical protein
MLSFREVSLWLTFLVNPVACEDWLANREFFGPVENPNDLDKELELAYLIAMARNGKLSRGKDLPLEVALSGFQISGSEQLGSVWILAPSGQVDLKKKVALELSLEKIEGEKEKKNLGPGEIHVLTLDSNIKYKIKVGLNGKLRIDGKDSLSFEVFGASRLVVDTRGRPIAFWPTDIHKKKLVEWRKILN